MGKKIRHLEKKAKWVRRRVLEIVFKTAKGHIGGTFSCTDILAVLYYGGVLRVDVKCPMWPDRDRLVIGKGHVCLALYNIWVDLGFMEQSRLDEYCSNGSSLGGQLNLNTPGVDFNTGSLGHAIGIGAGIALAGKMDGKNYKAFALVGDGECAEGSIWESAMFASDYRLNNLIGIVDRNRLGAIDVVEDQRLEERFKACGWTCRVIDGHSFPEILAAFSDLDKLDAPLMIIADTIKGKGISFMEDGVKWHHSIPSKQEYERALGDLI